HRKYAEIDGVSGCPMGFATATRKVELFSTMLAAHGYSPLPCYEEPAFSPVSTPELAADYPLILTNAKKPQYLHSQHHGLASLRKTAPDPPAEVHPDTAARYGLTEGDWITIETPHASARARIRLKEYMLPDMV